MKNNSSGTASGKLNQAMNRVIFLVVTLSFALPRNAPIRSIAPETTNLPSMSRLSLEGVERVLVVSPHPDDETIAPGGLIQAALANGAEVRVVIVTNGDGQLFAPLLFGLDGGLLPTGYVSMGADRQAESLTALQSLGVPAGNVIFLGYPDRGLQPMLEKNWEKAAPYTAVFTRQSRSPYTGTYQPGALYCGENLLSDLQNLVNDYRPDLVILPHPADEHTDHAATSTFTTLAVAAIRSSDSAYQPALWAYLVHYGKYPVMPETDRSMGFFPPSDLVTAGDTWGVLALTEAEREEKSAAIEDYPTQTLLLGNFLPEFDRPNELFMLIPVEATAQPANASLAH